MMDSHGQAVEAGPATAIADIRPLELLIVDHYARQSHTQIGSLPAVLGRDEKDDVRLIDPWVSHSHCELFQEGGTLVVRDLDSKNGVFMRGVRIREAILLPGDCITLGRTEITVRYRHPAGTEESVADGSVPAPPPAARRPISGGPTTEELLY